MARKPRPFSNADRANQASGKAAGDAFKFNAMAIAQERVNKVMRATGIEAQRRIMMRTPVDTGRARANWNASKDAEDGSTVESTDAGPAMEKGRGVVKDCDFFAGDTLYISNGLPYINALEDGTSKQAPAGMVSVTMGEIGVFADQIAATLENKERD